MDLLTYLVCASFLLALLFLSYGLVYFYGYAAGTEHICDVHRRGAKYCYLDEFTTWPNYLRHGAAPGDGACCADTVNNAMGQR
jgi:hypothetical protein